MSRNDPPHVAGMLDLLGRGAAPGLNQVLPGDDVVEVSGRRQPRSSDERAQHAS